MENKFKFAKWMPLSFAMLAGVMAIAGSAPAFAEAAAPAAEQKAPIVPWANLTGLKPEQITQIMGMVGQIAQQAMSAASGSSSAAGTPVTTAPIVPVQLTPDEIATIYNAGFADGKRGLDADSRYNGDINYLNGYIAGAKAKNAEIKV